MLIPSGKLLLSLSGDMVGTSMWEHFEILLVVSSLVYITKSKRSTGGITRKVNDAGFITQELSSTAGIVRGSEHLAFITRKVER
jgi:hypothetical protein